MREREEAKEWGRQEGKKKREGKTLLLLSTNLLLALSDPFLFGEQASFIIGLK